MPRVLRCFLVLVVAVVVVGTPLVYKYYRDADCRNFRVVREGVLYRSGQTSLAGLKRIIHDHGIKTVITLRDAHVQGDEPPDKEEQAYCRKEGYKFFRIPVRPWEASLGAPPADRSMAEFCRILGDPANYPVLIHCFAGIHRTGAFCAVYRMEFEDWTNSQAIAEMKALGYSTLDDEWDILGYMEQYRPGRNYTRESANDLTRPASYVNEP
jgi:tyrosine-protein phosphatase SIW14